MNDVSTNVAGIDIGKRRLAVAFWPAAEIFEVDNDAAGHAMIIERLRDADVERVGPPRVATRVPCGDRIIRLLADDRGQRRLRASPGGGVAGGRSGGRATAAGAGPRLCPDPAAACQERPAGRCLDRPRACPGAHPGGELEAPATTVDPACERLAEHLAFFKQVTEDLARLKTRRERFVVPELLAQLEAQIRAYVAERRAALARMRALLRDEAALLGRVRRIESVPGIGFFDAISLAVRMPELGRIDRRWVAALAGVAPFDQDSCGHHGERHVFGGRDRVRRLLYMAALTATRCNPPISALYRRLVNAGKAHKVANIACMRKLFTILTAMLRDDRDWDYQPT